MTKIDIFSGFLGAGKTTLIKKLISECYQNEKVVLIENEFGEIGIDGGFLQESGVTVNEMNSGCICCSLVGDFSKALKSVTEQYAPDRIIIEPSGVGKLSDVIKAVERAELTDAKINAYATVVDANKCKMYMKNFGEFFNDQIETANCIVLSHTEKISEGKLLTAIGLIQEHNPAATVVTTPWSEITGEQILAAIERTSTLESELAKMVEEHEHHDHECHCHEHGHEHHDHECHCHEHGHEHHDHECHCHEHGHEHHDHECHCHEHGHEHHGHHHADEVFTSWGKETANRYTLNEVEAALNELADSDRYGVILRAKGIVAGEDAKWIHFDYVPDEADVRTGGALVMGRLCVIGCNLNEENLAKLFRL